MLFAHFRHQHQTLGRARDEGASRSRYVNESASPRVRESVIEEATAPPAHRLQRVRPSVQPDYRTSSPANSTTSALAVGATWSGLASHPSTTRHALRSSAPEVPCSTSLTSQVGDVDQFSAFIELMRGFTSEEYRMVARWCKRSPTSRLRRVQSTSCSQVTREISRRPRWVESTVSGRWRPQAPHGTQHQRVGRT